MKNYFVANSGYDQFFGVLSQRGSVIHLSSPRAKKVHSLKRLKYPKLKNTLPVISTRLMK
jgi:hypothetical protein